MVNGTVRVDVKSAKYAEYGPCKGWFYRIGKVPQADVIALLQTDTGTVYWLPWYKCPTSNVTISRDGGKYAAFKDNWSVLRTVSDLRQKERELLEIEFNNN